MKIIALQGRANSGKTGTIRYVFELLKQHASSEPEVLKNGCDIAAVMTVNCTKIGVESQGDPEIRLKESLEYFVQAKCSIIVCSTRTSGMTVDWVKAVPGYSVEWGKQNYFDNQSAWNENNEAKAQEIVAKVLKATSSGCYSIQRMRSKDSGVVAP